MVLPYANFEVGGSYIGCVVMLHLKYRRGRSCENQYNHLPSSIVNRTYLMNDSSGSFYSIWTCFTPILKWVVDTLVVWECNISNTGGADYAKINTTTPHLLLSIEHIL
jgi:hypothetical protein